MRKYLEVMADVIRLLTFQTPPERPWEDAPRRGDRPVNEDASPPAGKRRRSRPE